MRFSRLLLAVAPLMRDRWLLGKHITWGGWVGWGRREGGREGGGHSSKSQNRL
jgi:hypothetical protein